MNLADLLDQHHHYEIAKGWTIGRNPRPDGPWHIYYKAKHVDCWEAEHLGKLCPDSCDLKSYPTAEAAVAACVQLRQVAIWAKQGA